MNDFTSSTATSVTQISEYLIVAPRDQISAGMIETDLNTILEEASKGIKGVVMNYAFVTIMDSAVFNAFRDVSAALDVMGIPSVWVCLRPGIVYSLLDLGLELDYSYIHTAGTLEEGILLLEKKRRERTCRTL